MVRSLSSPDQQMAGVFPALSHSLRCRDFEPDCCDWWLPEVLSSPSAPVAVSSAMRLALPLVIKGEHTPRLPSDGPACAKPRPLLPRCNTVTPVSSPCRSCCLSVRCLKSAHVLAMIGVSSAAISWS